MRKSILLKAVFVSAIAFTACENESNDLQSDQLSIESQELRVGNNTAEELELVRQVLPGSWRIVRVGSSTTDPAVGEELEINFAANNLFSISADSSVPARASNALGQNGRVITTTVNITGDTELNVGLPGTPAYNIVRFTDNRIVFRRARGNGVSRFVLRRIGNLATPIVNAPVVAPVAPTTPVVNPTTPVVNPTTPVVEPVTPEVAPANPEIIDRPEPVVIETPALDTQFRATILGTWEITATASGAGVGSQIEVVPFSSLFRVNIIGTNESFIAPFVSSMFVLNSLTVIPGLTTGAYVPTSVSDDEISFTLSSTSSSIGTSGLEQTITITRI